MKSKVKLSAFSKIITILIFALLGAISLYIAFMGETKDYIVLIIFLFLIIPSLYYSPTSIKVDDANITVKTYLRNHRIPLSDVKSVEPYLPWIGSWRICASGGLMGYWGIFRGMDIGNYVAYYGKSSECFLVRMKNGEKYVLGCENPYKIIDYINSKIPV